MHMIRRVIVATLVASLPAAAALGALPRVHAQDCPDCSEAQLEALAKSCDDGYSYITDFPKGKFYKVCYTSGRNERKDFRWEQPEPEYAKTFQAYLDVYRLNGHKQSIHAVIHADILMPNRGPAESSSAEQ